MKTQMLIGLGWLASISIGAAAEPGEWQYSGFASVDTRTFWEQERFAGQLDGTSASLVLQPEIYWRSDDGRQRVSVVAFGRHDADDDEREHADIREAYWGYESDHWDLRAGVAKVFWGVTESRHLVDVINQTDLVEDIDQEAKLGQAMLNVNWRLDFGRLELYYLPMFRERTFPGAVGRLRSPLPVDTGLTEYEHPEGDRHDDIAVRFSHYVGDVDFGIYAFDGTSREPAFVPAPDGSRLLPIYEQMQQVGIDVQYTRDAWLWKLEAIRRNTRSDTFAAFVGGFEYTLFGIGGHSADLGIISEYLYDDRGADAPPTPFDDDVFIGARLAFNDASDTSVLVGAVVDTLTHERFVNLEAERRFGANLVAELRLRAISNAKPASALYPLGQDDYLELKLSWFY